MSRIWGAMAMLVAGISIVVLIPMFLADEMRTGLFADGSFIFWIGWVLLAAGVLLLVLGLKRSRPDKRP